jgi:Leucine-rich repeat (LRR) protein
MKNNMKLRKIILVVLAALILSAFTVAAYAAPSMKRDKDTFEINEGVSDEILSQVKAEMGQVDQSKLRFILKKITNEDLAKLCAAFPDTVIISIQNSMNLSSLAPVAGLKGLQNMQLMANRVKDAAPLAGLTEMRRLDLIFNTFPGPDLKWMSGMTKLTNIKIGANLKGASSLEGIPSLPGLREIEISNAEIADLTPLVEALPALRKINFQAGTIHDLTPLTKLANLEELDLRRVEVKDLSPLAGCPKLKKVIVTKGVFSDTELSGFAGGVQVDQR